MAAPTKEGIDYFSFDVDLLDNDDLDFLRERYGVVVNDVYIALLTLLYRKKGYYIPYETETERKDCIWYIYKRVRGGKYPVQQELIPTVIEALVAQGLFDGNLFEKKNDRCNKIITSERAQKTYYKATVERKFESFDIRPEYWLLSDEAMRKLSKTHPYYLFLHPESKSDDYPSKSDDYPSKPTEKPLKKSKVNITSNEVIKVSKKEEINNSGSNITRARASYEEVMDSHNLDERVKLELWKFIQHCQLNGQKMTNDRLHALCRKLLKLYRPSDISGMVQALRTAIDKGYYDIKDGKGWIAESIDAMRAAGVKPPGGVDEEDE